MFFARNSKLERLMGSFHIFLSLSVCFLRGAPQKFCLKSDGTCVGVRWEMDEILFCSISANCGSHDSVVGMATKLRTEGSGNRILARAKDFFVLQNAYTGSGVYPASYSMGTGVYSKG